MKGLFLLLNNIAFKGIRDTSVLRHTIFDKDVFFSSCL
ncbi:hypothetical protein X975_01566, partial [Stegodyphus mimosarum]